MTRAETHRRRSAANITAVETETRQGYVPAPYHQDADETVQCPNTSCGRMNDTDANYCDQCDHPLDATTTYTQDADETVQCPECRLMNDDDAHFCDQCGIKLEGRPDVNIIPATEAEEAPDEPVGGGENITDVGSGFEDGVSTVFSSRIPRSNLVRDWRRRQSITRQTAADGQPAVELTGIFAAYNQWYEISSFWEGEFMERVAPGCFAQTIAEDIASMRCCFDHGFDPVIGDKPLGSIRQVVDTAEGPQYTVDLYNTDYVRDSILPLLEGELLGGEKIGSALGASMRFEVLEDQWLSNPPATPDNPKALPQRTILRAKVYEFGPVTFPANPGATAEVEPARSASDEWLQHLRDDQRFYAEFRSRVGERVAERIRQSIPHDLRAVSKQGAVNRRNALRLRAKAILLTSDVRQKGAA